MVANGRIPNLVTYSITIDYLCKNFHLSETMAFPKAIEASNMDLNLHIYTNFIKGMCKGDGVEAA